MNLIICCTPLQVLIAEKIIALHPQETFLGVMLHTVENKKFDYYKTRLQSKCNGFFSMLQHTDRFNLLKEIYRLKRYFGGKLFKQVFVANFTELHIQFLLSAVQFERLNTFDDGTVNIIKNSPLLNDDPQTMMRKSINLLLGNRYNSRTLRELSQAHYTIYPDFPNIVENRIPINLMATHNNTITTGETVNILLGQPIYRDESKNIALAQKTITQFKIDYYLPHPRETYRLNQVTYIDTPLIVEDYIIQSFQDKKCRIYTYFSSAILNLKGKNENIEVVALKIETDEPAFIACYELFQQVGINIVDIRA